MTDQTASVADPRRLLGEAPLTIRQIIAIMICVLLNALDGFDVLSISFASPGIAKEWGIERAALGVVLSMELVGMALGSVVLGQMADRIGRRPTVLGCLVVMACGMMATTLVGSISALAATRFITGLGIGGVLAAINALVAEYASDRTRSTAVGIMTAGYPLGAVVGGAIATMLLAHSDWRSVFTMGAAATALAIPLVFLFAPEPVGSIMQRRPNDALDQVNNTLRKLGHSVISALPAPDPVKVKASLAELFSTGQRRITLLLTMGYFLHILTFYFILKWIPKIVADMGYPPSQAGGVLVSTNIGGLVGALTFGALSLKLPLRKLLMLVMVISSVMVIYFGNAGSDLGALTTAAMIAGFFTNGAVVGLYALIAASYPTTLRAGGTGFVIGIGRGGAALAPMIGGVLFQMGLGLPAVAAAMGLGSLLAALAVWQLPEPRAGND